MTKVRKYLSRTGNNDPYVVKIPRELYDKAQFLCRHTKTEVSWVSHCYREGNTFTLEGFFIPKQQCHTATTEFDDDAIFDLMENAEGFKHEDWRFWGHKHPGGVSPSGQDEDMMLDFAESCDWFVGGIHNAKGEMFYWIIDNEAGLFLEHVKVEIIENPSEEYVEILDAIREKVSEITWNRKWSGTAGNVNRGAYTLINGRKVYDSWSKGLQWDVDLEGFVEQEGYYDPQPYKNEAYTRMNRTKNWMRPSDVESKSKSWDDGEVDDDINEMTDEEYAEWLQSKGWGGFVS